MEYELTQEDVKELQHLFCLGDSMKKDAYQFQTEESKAEDDV
jgi:hypothetical protein